MRASGKSKLKFAIVSLTALGSALLATTAVAGTKVRYSEVLRSIFYLPTYIAMANHFFDQEGIEIDLSTAWGSDKGTAALMTGAADIALLGPESVVYVANSPSPVKAKMFCSLTAKDGLILVSRQKIAPADFKWDMLKGKTLLSWRAGNTPQVDTDWVLKQHGLDPKKDVEDITNLASGNRDGAWLSGKGDFGTFFEPTVSIIQSKGMGYPLLSIGNEIGPVDFTGFVALDNYLAANSSVAQGWCNAVYKAQKVVASSSPEQLAAAAAPYFPQLDRELLVSSIGRYKELGIWKTDPGIDAAGMAKIQDIMVAGGMLKAAEKVAFDKIVTNKFADGARERVK